MGTFSEIGYIYKYTNIINNKSYIGKTKNINNRRVQHEKNITIRKNTKFGNALRKYPIDNFNFSILCTIRTSDLIKLDNILNNLEMYFIKKYDSLNIGYNLTLGGDGFIGYKHSKETIIKIKQGKQFISEHTKSKISNSMMGSNNPRFGKILTLEQKINLITSRNIKILQFDKNNNLIKEWESISEAARILKTSKSHISSCCQNKRKTACKFIWKYK